MTTTLIIQNIWTKIYSDDPSMLDYAEEVASFTMKNWEIRRNKWMERLRKERRVCQSSSATCSCEWCRALRWDGKKFIGRKFGESLWIPTGCTSTYLSLLRVRGEEIIIENERTRPPVLQDVDWSPKREAREYQEEAIQAILKNGRGIIKSPTASGKTVMIALLIGRLKTTTLIKVPRIVLMKQMYREITNTINIHPNDIGMIGDGKYEPSLITITTTQSLASIMKRPKDWNELMDIHRSYGWGMLIEDECHHGSTNTSYNTSMKIDAYYRIGFSATPLMREDGENIKTIGAYGDIIHDIKKAPLIENGWLIDPRITFIPVKSIPSSSGDRWQDMYQMGIVYNRERNRKIINIANDMFAEGRSTLIFVDRIDHGEELLNMASSDATHEVEFVHGTHDERDELLKRFKQRDLMTLISTEGIIGEGFDFKGLDALVIGDGGKSAIQTLQKVGRAMRPEDGKVDCKIFDFADRGKYLTDHAISRKTTWMKHGFEVDTSQTPYLR
ncbi:MAG: DEAD/DEAH box helicase [Candidatus Lokiarchaeota archaeon]|nr:DEAD/DEAH box helicase [Candidatus Lokiarchaeota archaeon]